MYAANAQRDSRGRLIESPDSLHPKTIGLRLKKSTYPKFLEIAEQFEMTPTELARAIVERFVDDLEKSKEEPEDDQS